MPETAELAHDIGAPRRLTEQSLHSGGKAVCPHQTASKQGDRARRRGTSADCGSPVAKPSREMDKLWIRVSDIGALLDW
jgi:hypothetical protein